MNNLKDVKTKLKLENDKFYEVSEQDLANYWKQIKAAKEIKPDVNGCKIAFSIPAVLYHEISNKLGFKLYDLGKGSEEEKADKQRAVMELLKKDYPLSIIHK